VTPEPLNTVLIVLLLGALALFALAWLVMLAGVVVFIVTSLRFKRLRAEVDLTAEQEAVVERALRLGRRGLWACAVLVVCYVLRGWAGDYYYEEIAQGLVPYSSAWWIVWPLTVLWWCSVPVGIAGTIAAWIGGIRLRRVMKSTATASVAVVADAPEGGRIV
jgi:hypothetical protein